MKKTIRTVAELVALANRNSAECARRLAANDDSEAREVNAGNNFKNSVQKHGVLAPITVYLDRDDNPEEIADGIHRTFWAQAQGIETLECHDLPYMERKDRIITQFQLQDSATPYDPITRSEKYAELSRAGMKTAEIAQLTGRTPQTVSNDLAAQACFKYLREKCPEFDVSRMPYGHAKQFGWALGDFERSADPALIMPCVEAALQNKLTARAFRDQLNELLEIEKKNSSENQEKQQKLEDTRSGADTNDLTADQMAKIQELVNKESAEHADSSAGPTNPPEQNAIMSLVRELGGEVNAKYGVVTAPLHIADHGNGIVSLRLEQVSITSDMAVDYLQLAIRVIAAMKEPAHARLS